MMASQQNPFGFRREIKRGNRASYWRTEELLCPCCGHLTRVEWEQECFNKPPITETHCENLACAAYMRTTDIDSFFETYGQNKLQSNE